MEQNGNAKSIVWIRDDASSKQNLNDKILILILSILGD